MIRNCDKHHEVKVQGVVKPCWGKKKKCPRAKKKRVRETNRQMPKGLKAWNLRGTEERLYL